MLMGEYYDDEPGYHPFLITESWQVAQLNYIDAQGAAAITKLDLHYHTDETFTLLKGRAFLIAAQDGKEEMEMVWLRPGYTYNIPAGVWHNIAMQEGSSVLITENALTHEAETGFRSLSTVDQEKIQEFDRQGGSI